MKRVSQTQKVLNHLHKWIGFGVEFSAAKIQNIAELVGCNGWSEGVQPNLMKRGAIIRTRPGHYVLRPRL